MWKYQTQSKRQSEQSKQHNTRQPENRLPVRVATEQKELEANEIMQDRGQIEEEKDKKTPEKKCKE